jgi:hypothetical protein
MAVVDDPVAGLRRLVPGARASVRLTAQYASWSPVSSLMVLAQAPAHCCRGSGSKGEPATSSSSQATSCRSPASSPQPTWSAQ